jgi:hypothetical protein
MKMLASIVLLLLTTHLQGGYLPTVPATLSGGNNISILNACANNTSVSSSSLSAAIYNSAATLGCTNTSFTPTANDVALVVFYFKSGGASPSCTTPDALGNTWTSTAHQFGGGDAYLLCYSKLTTGGNVAVVGNSGGGTDTILSLSYEMSGAQNVLDSTLQNGTTSGTAWTLPSVTTTNANDVIFGCGSATANSLTYTAGSPFVIFSSFYYGGQNPSEACEYHLETTTGTKTPAFTVSTSQAGVAVTFAVKST